MTEHDTFEVRLQAAVHRYVGHVSSDLDPVAFAMTIAAAEPRRHGTPAALAWGRPRVSRSLVLLLLLTGLLGVLLGGALIAGSAPTWRPPAVVPPVVPTTEAAFACPSGTDPKVAGPATQARPPISGYPAPMAFDRRAGRIVLLAQAAAGAQTWTFDVCSNTWTQMHPGREPTLAPWLRQLVYDVDSDVTVAIDWDPPSAMNRVWAYDLEANTWTAKALVPVSLERQIDLAYDAASGLIVVMSSTSAVAADPWELWTYDVDTDTWTAVRQARDPAVITDHAYQWLAYDASVDRLIWYEQKQKPAATSPLPFETWRFDLRAGTWSKSDAISPAIGAGYGGSGGEMAYDEATRQTLVFSRGRVIAYDATADRWTVLVQGWDPEATSGPGFLGYGPRYTDLQGPTMVYDSVNERMIVYGGTYPSETLDSEGLPVWVRADDVLAFDPVTREWSVILAASVVRPES